MGWREDVTIHKYVDHNLSLKLNLRILETRGRMWAIFIYASNKEKERVDQWNELWSRKGLWGDNLILGGDLNWILASEYGLKQVVKGFGILLAEWT